MSEYTGVVFETMRMLDEHAVSPASGNVEGSLDAETARLDIALKLPVT
jgi:hypothetical protein